MKQLSIQSIGAEALAAIRGGGAARVIGSTSKGIFAITDARQVFFLSYERYRSPLTINLGKADEDLRRVEIGEGIKLNSIRMRMEFENALVDCSVTQPWLVLPPAKKASHPSIRERRITAVAAGIAAQRPGIGFSPLVSSLVLNRSDGLAAPEFPPEVGLRIEHIMRASRSRDLETVLAEMGGILGFGRGLTPSGDDFVMGFLLAANRWGVALGCDRKSVESFDGDIIEMAVWKTTSLSAAMIRLAAKGEGDERQLAVVDGLMCGEPAVEICLKNVLEMGSSSGIDAFLGMAAVIL